LKLWTCYTVHCVLIFKSLLIFLNVSVKPMLNIFFSFFLQIPVLAVEIAMDHKPSHREMTSVLISDLYGRIVTQKDIARGWLLFHTSG